MSKIKMSPSAFESDPSKSSYILSLGNWALKTMFGSARAQYIAATLATVVKHFKVGIESLPDIAKKIGEGIGGLTAAQPAGSQPQSLPASALARKPVFPTLTP